MARIAGLPFQVVEQFSLQSIENVDAIITGGVALDQEKDHILAEIERIANLVSSDHVRKHLHFFKIKFSKNNKIKFPRQLGSYLNEKDKPLLDGLRKRLGDFIKMEVKLKTEESDFTKVYEKVIIAHRRILQQQTTEPILLNGLLLSSRTLMDQLPKYSLSDPARFAKKQFQTERALLQYLSRICCKTSPFSAFTQLSVFSFDEAIQTPQDFTSKVSLNNHLFAVWKDALNSYPPFHRQLMVCLNPGLRLEGEEWTFLLNTRNIETVQKIQNTDFLEFIVEVFQKAGGEKKFCDLTDEILPNLETELEALETYLLELIAFGFLEWKWPFSGLDLLWIEKLIELLENVGEDEFLLEIKMSLEKISELTSLYETADIEKRNLLQLQTFHLAKHLSESLLEKVQLAEKENLIDFGRIKHVKQNQFKFTPEKLFYEDVCTGFTPFFKESELEPVIMELDQLLNSLEPLYFNSFQLELKLFFQQNYSNAASISLLKFYEDFHKNKNNFKPDESTEAVNLRLKWQAEIFRQSAEADDGVLKIDPAILNSLSKKTGIPNTQKTTRAKGALIQLFREGNVLKGFSENAFEGNGKMMGRFLDMFPKVVTATLRQWNETQRNGLLWIENTDASVYNPNAHPPLLPYEIRLPGSQNALPHENQVLVSDLKVIYNETEDALNLIHQPSGRRAYIFDMGFEALESRSPLYRLLAAFTFPGATQNILTDIVNDYFESNSNHSITFYPRICVGKHLVIQRKKWHIPFDFLPVKKHDETEAAYFIRINRWIKENHIPSKVFITIKPPNGNRSGVEKTDDYKPQYIDFQSPVFVQLFHKLIKKVKDKLRIEEFLPLPEKQENGKILATEFLIQWMGGIS